MAIVQGAEIIELIVDGGESAKNLNRLGMERLLSLVDAGKVQTVIIAKLDGLTRSVKDLAELLERFQRRGVSLVSVAESLDTGSAAGAGSNRRAHAGRDAAQKIAGAARRLYRIRLPAWRRWRAPGA